ncbi:hypothetical protein BC834DRAFT_871063 [Gloeopeniophorella convolvens]|nr:hypothetical protein BC834DRAFT_871063 [Gloeopeniophorella convolvens]
MLPLATLFSVVHAVSLRSGMLLTGLLQATISQGYWTLERDRSVTMMSTVACMTSSFLRDERLRFCRRFRRGELTNMSQRTCRGAG